MVLHWTFTGVHPINIKVHGSHWKAWQDRARAITILNFNCRLSFLNIKNIISYAIKVQVYVCEGGSFYPWSFFKKKKIYGMPIQRCPPPPAKKSKAPVIEVTHHYSEKAMATHSSTLAWKIPWAEEPGRLQSIGSWSQTWLSDFTFTFHFHALEKEMAAHSTVLAWRIPGTAEPGGLPSMGSHRVRHDWSELAAAASLVI